MIEPPSQLSTTNQSLPCTRSARLGLHRQLATIACGDQHYEGHEPRIPLQVFSYLACGRLRALVTLFFLTQRHPQ
jgi:hypothetical protein